MRGPEKEEGEGVALAESSVRRWDGGFVEASIHYYGVLCSATVL